MKPAHRENDIKEDVWKRTERRGKSVEKALKTMSLFIYKELEPTALNYLVRLTHSCKEFIQGQKGQRFTLCPEKSCLMNRH